MVDQDTGRHTHGKASDDPRKDTVIGGAGQRLNRRDILRRSIAGFAVLGVGAKMAAQGAPPPTPTCGNYNAAEQLVGDALCGQTHSWDAACGLTHELTGETYETDFGCVMNELDRDCSLLANSEGMYNSDSMCGASEWCEDADCGLLGSPDNGYYHRDNACTPESEIDVSCGKLTFGGGLIVDGRST